MKDMSKLKVVCDESKKWRAAVQNHFVAEFDEQVRIKKGPGASSSELELPAQKASGTELRSVAPGPKREAALLPRCSQLHQGQRRS